MMGPEQLQVYIIVYIFFLIFFFKFYLFKDFCFICLLILDIVIRVHSNYSSLRSSCC